MTRRERLAWPVQLVGGIVVVVVLVVCVTITLSAEGNLNRARQRITSYQSSLGASQAQTAKAQNAATQDRALVIAQQAALTKLEAAYEAATGHPSGVPQPAVPTTPTSAPTTSRASTPSPSTATTSTTSQATSATSAQPAPAARYPPAVTTTTTTGASTTSTTIPILGPLLSAVTGLL